MNREEGVGEEPALVIRGEEAGTIYIMANGDPTTDYRLPNTQHLTPNTPFSLRLFGAFEARADGQPLPALRTVKGKYLLALLALRAGQDVSRQWLAENLWPDSEAPSDSLRQALSDLRAKMGTQAVRLETPAKSTLRLNCENAEIDALAFDKAIKRGDAEGLRQAVAWYRGDLLEGASEVWILGEREARRQAYLKALETLAAYAHVDGDLQGEIAYLRRALACDPCREAATRNVMEALAKAGEPQAALETYHRLRQRLLDEGNIAPEATTQAAYGHIRQQAIKAQNQAKSGIEKSQDVSAAFAPKEGVHSSAPSSFEALPFASMGNMPVALTSLIGRDDLLREVKARLLTHRLVTLAGTGGVGKTRLAIQAARELQESPLALPAPLSMNLPDCPNTQHPTPNTQQRHFQESFEDGIWFADLSTVTASAPVVQHIAALFQIRAEPGISLAQALNMALQSRRMLLVLDNCETCLQECATTAQELLRACPYLHLLATSRQRLGLISESVFAVEPLAVLADDSPEMIGSDFAADFAASANSPAAQLFTTRAQSVSNHFALTPQNVSAVAEICRRLDGLPLALELAASLIEMLTPQEIVTHLNQRFDMLTDTPSTRPRRHQSLRAVIASSVDLLTEPERALLRRLSVFTGGWTLEAAQQINDERGMMNDELKSHSSLITHHSSFGLLRSLVAKSLVVAEEANGQMRYRMLETIGEYAREMLAEAGEEEAMRVRHLDWMTQVAQQAERELTGPGQSVWLERLEAETGNLRYALDWAETQADCRRRGLLLANALGRWWQIRGYFTEGRERLRRLLDAPETQEFDACRANGWNWFALLSVFACELAEAETACDEALEIWKALNGEPLKVHNVSATINYQLSTINCAGNGAAGALGIRGIIAANKGDYEGAQQWYRQSLEGARAAGDRAGEAGTLGYLGINAVNQGYYEEAKQYYEASLRLRREMNDTWGIAASLNNLGQLARKNRQPELARNLLTEALMLRRQLRDRRNMGITLNILGLIAWEQGDQRNAAAYFLEATELFAQLGDRRNLAYALESWARMAVSTNEPELAVQFYEGAQRLRQEIKSPLHLKEQSELERLLYGVRTTVEEARKQAAQQQEESRTLEQTLTEARAFGLTITGNSPAPNRSEIKFAEQEYNANHQ